MTYHLDRGLFIENGPTVLAMQAREARAVAQAYEILGAPRPATAATPDDAKLRAAA